MLGYTVNSCIRGLLFGIYGFGVLLRLVSQSKNRRLFLLLVLFRKVLFIGLYDLLLLRIICKYRRYYRRFGNNRCLLMGILNEDLLGFFFYDRNYYGTVCIYVRICFLSIFFCLDSIVTVNVYHVVGSNLFCNNNRSNYSRRSGLFLRRLIDDNRRYNNVVSLLLLCSLCLSGIKHTLCMLEAVDHCKSLKLRILAALFSYSLLFRSDPIGRESLGIKRE